MTSSKPQNEATQSSSHIELNRWEANCADVRSDVGDISVSDYRTVLILASSFTSCFRSAVTHSQNNNSNNTVVAVAEESPPPAL